MPIGAICASKEVAKSFTMGPRNNLWRTHRYAAQRRPRKLIELIDLNCAQNAGKWEIILAVNLKNPACKGGKASGTVCRS